MTPLHTHMLPPTLPPPLKGQKIKKGANCHACCGGLPGNEPMS